MAARLRLLATLLVAIVAISFFGLTFLQGDGLQGAGETQAEGDYVNVCFAEACVQAELARTPQERSKGLMFRESLEEGKGMLFVFEDEATHSFWMKNTLIPLDIIWIGADKKVVHVETAVPCKAEPCQFYAPSKPSLYALEANAGFAERKGIESGSDVEFELG